MSRKLILTFAAAVLAVPPFAVAKDHTLPDACGSDKVRYVVTDQEKPVLPLAPPAEGKAQIVFIQKMGKAGNGMFAGDYSVRFGVDGSWAGADGNNSYFTVDVAPGEHHLCAAVQDFSGARADMINVSSFTAEAGKVYYYQFGIKLEQRSAAPAPGTSGFTVTVGGKSGDSTFGQIDEDEGKFRIKELKVSKFRLPVGGS